MELHPHVLALKPGKGLCTRCFHTAGGKEGPRHVCDHCAFYSLCGRCFRSDVVRFVDLHAHPLRLTARSSGWQCTYCKVSYTGGTPADRWQCAERQCLGADQSFDLCNKCVFSAAAVGDVPDGFCTLEPHAAHEHHPHTLVSELSKEEHKCRVCDLKVAANRHTHVCLRCKHYRVCERCFLVGGQRSKQEAHAHPVRETMPSHDWTCNACGTAFAPAAKPTRRWRCAIGCGFDVCERCVEGSQPLDYPVPEHHSKQYTWLSRLRSSLGLAKHATTPPPAPTPSLKRSASVHGFAGEGDKNGSRLSHAHAPTTSSDAHEASPHVDKSSTSRTRRPTHPVLEEAVAPPPAKEPETFEEMMAEVQRVLEEERSAGVHSSATPAPQLYTDTASRLAELERQEILQKEAELEEVLRQELAEAARAASKGSAEADEVSELERLEAELRELERLEQEAKRGVPSGSQVATPPPVALPGDTREEETAEEECRRLLEELESIKRSSESPVARNPSSTLQSGSAHHSGDRSAISASSASNATSTSLDDAASAEKAHLHGLPRIRSVGGLGAAMGTEEGDGEESTRRSDAVIRELQGRLGCGALGRRRRLSHPPMRRSTEAEKSASPPQPEPGAGRPRSASDGGAMPMSIAARKLALEAAAAAEAAGGGVEDKTSRGPASVGGAEDDLEAKERELALKIQLAEEKMALEREIASMSSGGGASHEFDNDAADDELSALEHELALRLQLAEEKIKRE